MSEGSERFTDRVGRVVALAGDEARALGRTGIDPEHVLLGLLAEGRGVAAQALQALGVDAASARSRVEEISGRGGRAPDGPISPTPRTDELLERSLQEALRLGQTYVGTEHVLLALAGGTGDVAARVLVALGTDGERVRRQVLQQLSHYRT